MLNDNHPFQCTCGRLVFRSKIIPLPLSQRPGKGIAASASLQRGHRSSTSARKGQTRNPPASATRQEKDAYRRGPPRGRVYLRLSVTDCCGLRCRYCRPEGDVDWSGGHSSLPKAGENACPTRPDVYPIDSNGSRASREELLAITELIAGECRLYLDCLTSLGGT